MRLRLLSLALLIGSSVLSAQSFTPVRERKSLSPAAIDKLHTLETLTTLPSGDWRTHIGDIPHGESTTLDDSAWPLAALKGKGSKDAIWYRREITVPANFHGYDITGARILFQFRATCPKRICSSL